MPDRVADVLVADTVAASRAMDLHMSIVYYIIWLSGNLRRSAARINRSDTVWPVTEPYPHAAVGPA